MATWQEQAKALHFGGKRKIMCCGSSASAYISNSEKGVALYCFRCGASEFERHSGLTVSEVLRMRASERELRAQGTPSTVPVQDGPVAGLVWLLRTGLRPEIASSKYKIGWSEKYQRVIVPVLNEFKETGAWTARAVDGRSPKYIASSKRAFWKASKGDTLVVVEDVLSAIKIYEAGFGAMACMGTSINSLLLDQITAPSVVGWFDNDPAGDAAWVKLRKASGLYSFDLRRVKGIKDPKLYTKQEIQELIG